MSIFLFLQGAIDSHRRLSCDGLGLAHLMAA
jgi:hypothetical protein